MADYSALVVWHRNRPVDAKKVGQALAGAMDDEHEKFMLTILAMLDGKEIDVYDPQTYLKRDVYDALPQEWKDRTDLALSNIARELQRIVAFRVSKETPDQSPQLQTMIEHLWQMKQRIEKEHDVFKF